VPGRIFTPQERKRLDAFPSEIGEADLIRYFTLSRSDLDLVRRQRGDHNRLGFALQLCALRYIGFSPDDLEIIPTTAVAFAAEQLQASPAALHNYGVRSQTRTEHLQQIQLRLGFRDATREDFSTLADWLLTRALEHDKPSLLYQLACEHLHAKKIIRLGVTRIERLVMETRERGHRETFRRLGLFFTEERLAQLDQVLVREEQLGRSPLAWLGERAGANTSKAIVAELKKLDFLRELGVTEWDLSTINPNRLKFLAQIGRRATSQALQRLAPARRYPIIASFLRHSMEEITDEFVDIFDRCLAQSYSRAGRELDEFRQTNAKATNQKLVLLREIGRVVLDLNVSDEQLRQTIYRYVPADTLLAAVEECDQLIRPLDDSYFDFLARRYSHIREFAPAFLHAFKFRSNRNSDPLLQAVELLRNLNQERRRAVPPDAPLKFVPTKWHPYVVDGSGRIDRHYYELCVLWELRAALRAGDVWLEGSRRYANPESYLIPPTDWPALRPEVCSLTQTPGDGAVRLKERQAELEMLLRRFDDELPHHPSLRIENDSLVVGPLKAEDEQPSLAALEALVDARLPLVELPDLLMEVDGWTGFSRHLEHAGGAEPRASDLLVHCHASILAQACNFGLTRMAQLADLSYRQLAWCTTWYLREETLQPAIASIVNRHYRHPLARLWGGGTLSSSDGQRFPVAVRSQTATAIPRYFGFGTGLTFYTWTSDQSSQYGSKPIPSTVRDSTYVLDGVLDNETELPIAEHTTDTTGYTDLVFGLFDLLGLQFSPRLRDLADQTLYRIDKSIRYQRIGPLVRGAIDPRLFLAHWDDLLRTAGSLKLGWVTASLFIAKLQSARRKNVLTRALQEYGRLNKTIFILRYLLSEQVQRRIGTQINKGEALHALRGFLFLANEGKIRRRYYQEQLNQASCLNLVTNAVVLWNTVYMSAVLEQLKAEGYPVDDADVAHLWPARYGHINPYGKYRFNVDAEFHRKGLRPLRRPDSGLA
jgi:TnpA family transposase